MTSSDASGWTVTPLLLGHRQAHVSWFGYLESDSGTLEIAYRSWLLRNGDAVVVVDTGPPPDESRVRGLVDVVSVVERLAERGVLADEVGCVVLTHLHWGHAFTRSAPKSISSPAGPGTIRRRLASSATETCCRA